MTDLHEDRKWAGKIPGTAVRVGVNADNAVYDEEAFIRCRKCQHTYNTQRFPRGIGDGISTSDTSYTITWEKWAEEQWGSFYWGGVAGYYGEPSVSSGCPFCGYVGAQL